MKTNVVSTFYSDYSTLNRNLCNSIDGAKRLAKYKDATDLWDIIQDATDFGISAIEEPKLLPFFDDLKAYTSDFLNSLNEHIEQKGIYDAIGLSSIIGDTDHMGDGVTGAELKAAITSITALDAYLTSSYNYAGLFKILYTAKRMSSTWEPGILGSEFKLVLFGMTNADTFLRTGLHYTNLDKLL